MCLSSKVWRFLLGGLDFEVWRLRFYGEVRSLSLRFGSACQDAPGPRTSRETGASLWTKCWRRAALDAHLASKIDES